MSGTSYACRVCPVHVGSVPVYLVFPYQLCQVYWLSICGCVLLYPYCVFLFPSDDPVPEEDEEEVEGINPFSPGDPGPGGV